MHIVKNILQRVKIALDIGTDTDLATYLGVHSSTISTWKSRNSLDYESILAICHKFDLDYSWILYGISSREGGKSTKIDVSLNKKLEETYVNEDQKIYSTEFSPVEYYPQAYASAGHGLVAEEKAPLYLSFRKYFISNTLNASAKDLVVLRVKGDSMEPEIMSDDDILVDRSRNKPRFGPAYLIRLDDVLHCKLIQTFGEERWRIMSKNPSYESFDINPKTDPIEIIGEVVWWGRKSKYL